MKHAIVAELSFDTLSHLLGLPATQRVTRAEYNISTDSVRVLIEGEGLPLRPERCPAMTVRPEIRHQVVTTLVWPEEVGNGSPK